jgi:hypothetical protein
MRFVPSMFKGADSGPEMLSDAGDAVKNFMSTPAGSGVAMATTTGLGTGLAMWLMNRGKKTKKTAAESPEDKVIRNYKLKASKEDLGRSTWGNTWRYGLAGAALGGAGGTLGGMAAPVSASWMSTPHSTGIPSSARSEMHDKRLGNMGLGAGIGVIGGGAAGLLYGLLRKRFAKGEVKELSKPAAT